MDPELLYGSGHYDDAVKFFDYFATPSDLINWMKGRMKDHVVITEIDGPKDVVIVIPTRSIDSEFARYCQNILFKGFHIIFAASQGGRFNYSYSVNIGIKEAIKHEPKWIIVSNDDMRMKHSPSKLRSEIMKYSPDKYRLLHTQGPGFHSKPVKFGPRSAVARFLYLSENNKRVLKIENSLKKRMGEIFTLDNFTLKHRFFTKNLLTFRNPGSFFILSKTFLETLGGKVFDETFINGAEDLDFSLRYLDEGTTDIDYFIADIGGQSLGGIESMRYVWDIANRVYLTHLYNEGTYTL